MRSTIGVGVRGSPIAHLQSVETSPIPTLNPIHLNITVLLFTIIDAGVAVGVLFGLTPALQVSRCSHADLKSQASSALLPKRQRSLHDFLIVGELAISVTLLVGAALLTRSVATLRNSDIGVNRQNIATMQIVLSGGQVCGFDGVESVL